MLLPIVFRVRWVRLPSDCSVPHIPAVLRVSSVLLDPPVLVRRAIAADIWRTTPGVSRNAASTALSSLSAEQLHVAERACSADTKTSMTRGSPTRERDMTCHHNATEVNSHTLSQRLL
jgi:hypothetical protein